MPLWLELLFFVWGLVYVVIGLGAVYIILTAEAMEPLAVIFVAAVGAFTLWSGGKTLHSLFTDKWE